MITIILLSCAFSTETNASLTKRSMKLILKIPFNWLEWEYTRTWKGDDNKTLCPVIENPTCEYTMTVGVGMVKLGDPGIGPDDQIIDVLVDSDAPDTANFGILRLDGSSDWPPIEGEEFLLSTEIILAANDTSISGGNPPPFDLVIPAQITVYSLAFNGFIFYY